MVHGRTCLARGRSRVFLWGDRGHHRSASLGGMLKRSYYIRATALDFDLIREGPQHGR
jgi:hypothetical protein